MIFAYTLCTGVPSFGSSCGPALAISTEGTIDALKRIYSAVQPSRGRFIRNASFSFSTGNLDVVLFDQTQVPTRAFKIRGVSNFVLKNRENLSNGAVAATSGNHGIALAHMGLELGFPVTIIVSRNASEAKVKEIESLGAKVIREGSSIDEATVYAKSLSEKESRLFVPTNEHSDIIEGHATILLDILEAVPKVNIIVSPVGGGALMAGISQIVRENGLKITTIGVQPANAPSMYNEFYGLSAVAAMPTLADAVSRERVIEPIATIYKNNLDQMSIVSENSISQAVAELRKFGIEAEGAAALPLAALIEGKIQNTMSQRLTVVLIVTGGTR